MEEKRKKRKEGRIR